MRNHRILIVKSKEFYSDEPIHTNVRVLCKGDEIRYGEYDLKDTSKIIEINSKVEFPYLTYAVKKIIEGMDNFNVVNVGSFFSDVKKYEEIINIIEENKSKLEKIEDGFDVDEF